MTGRKRGGHVRDWIEVCDSLPPAESGETAVRRYFETWFQAYEITNDGSGGGLFTGYFEPDLQGAPTRGGDFTIPIHQRPDDLVLAELGDWRSALRGERIAGRVVEGRLEPYHSRADIIAGALVGKAEPLVWVKDPVAAFFLHVQGSGRIMLPDGAVFRVGYAGHNGHVYYPIGRYLLETGEIEKQTISLQSIRAWLKANPDRMQDVLNRNPSYIFFRAIDGAGPIGAQGVPLTPGRSLAVDPRFVPLGAPVWVSIDYPDESGRPLRRMMVAQDTGGAIKGPVRGDVFWGHGERAGVLAGPMKATGRLYLLLPRSLTVIAAQ